MDKPNHLARAAGVWDALVAASDRRAWITYGDLGRQIAVHHRALRYALEPVQAYCMEEDLPPLTILVRSADGKLGAGFIAWDHARLEEGQEKVFSCSWRQHENPFAPWRSGETMDLLVREVLDAPLQAAQVFARVRVRGVQQQIFRAVLMELYEGACAVSGSTVEEGLEACHIISWTEASAEEAFLPQNGILMGAWYHRLFDAGLLEIDERYVVRISKQLLTKAAPADRDALYAVSDQIIRLPARRKYWPSQELLARHTRGR